MASLNRAATPSGTQPAITRGNAPKEATVKIPEYKELELFLVKGEGDEPASCLCLARRVRPVGFCREA